MNKFWFRSRKGIKSKDVGWGLVPISWEGVLMGIVLFILVALSAFYFDLANATLSQGLYFLITLLVLLVMFSLIARKKTKNQVE